MPKLSPATRQDLKAPALYNRHHEVTSSKTPNYNCIAWAYGIDTLWMWPATRHWYWPPGITNDLTVDAFRELFVSIGYQDCSDGSHEVGIEKVVIYVRGGIPVHAARQLANGHWTSKLGQLEDIEHWFPSTIEGGVYGSVTFFMSRPLKAAVGATGN